MVNALTTLPHNTRLHESTRAAALGWWEAGYSVLPPLMDGSKAPLAQGGTWKTFQTERASREQVGRWYARGQDGAGVCTGYGNLEMFEFDDRHTYDLYLEAARHLGISDVVGHVEETYCEDTPSGGVHWFWRTDAGQGNRKLARRPATPDELEREPNKPIRTLIETKGVGGYGIIAPSGGRVHPSGGTYALRSGKPSSIITITPEERADMFRLAKAFDRMPKVLMSEPRAASSVADGTRPGDVFNMRAVWADILGPHGWTPVYQTDGATHWRRPGKARGTSATTDYADSSLLYVFSSSTPFEPERGYSKFSAYALLEHDGDFTAAARALAAEGYGMQPNGALPAKMRPAEPRRYFRVGGAS